MDAVLPVFIRPLTVEIGGTGNYRHAETVQELAQMLVGGKWPANGKAFHSALWRSVEAIECYVDAETARCAFVEAAHEAGLHIVPDDQSEMKKAS
nr:DUF982 domain-containing protein [Rhizobium sp. 42MFCr.1]